MCRKIASLLLSVVMLLGVLPGTVFAAEATFGWISFREETYQGSKVAKSICFDWIGEKDEMLLSDIKDFKITCEGNPVNVKLVETADTLNIRNQWWNDTESGVGFKFDFSEWLTEPGWYEVTFTYKGQTYTSGYPIEGTSDTKQEAPDDAILIGTEAELRAFAEAVNNGEYEDRQNPYVKLKQDIELTGGEWTPIGAETDAGGGSTAYHMFSGFFDGGGHKITGIKIGSKENPATMENIGFFLEAPRSVFDLTLEIEFYATKSHRDTGMRGIGGLAARGNGNVINCAVSGIIETDMDRESYVGGLMGDSLGSVADCWSSVTINTYTTAGGLIGSGRGSLINCCATGDVSGETVGGLIGVGGGYIERCYATGNVTAKPGINEYEGTEYCMGSAGGFCGFIGMNSEDDMILNCFASGNVTLLDSGIECNGGCNAGGFAGNISGSYGSVENCYALGSVQGHTAAGFAADVMSPSPDGSWGDGTLYISHCFASGNVISETGSAAGFVSSSIGAWLYDCASLGDVTAKDDAKGFASEFGFAGIERCWSVGDVTSQEGYASIFGNGKNCYAIGNASGKDASGYIGEHGYFAGTLKAAPNDDSSAKTFNLGDTSYGDITVFPVGYDPSVTTGKTTAEMQTQAFADLLNADQHDRPWKYRAGSYPVLAYHLLPVSVTASEGGTLYAPPYASAGDEVVLFAVPDDGYQLKTLQYNGTAINGASFAMPDVNVTVTAEFESVSAGGETVDSSSSDPSSTPNGEANNTSDPNNTQNSGDNNDAKKPISPIIYIGGGVVLLCLIAALILLLIGRKSKKADKQASES